MSSGFANAFQSNAFQNNAFQVGPGVVTTAIISLPANCLMEQTMTVAIPGITSLSKMMFKAIFRE